MPITISNIEICSVPASTDYFTQLPSGVNDSRNLFSSLGSNIYELSGNGSYVTIFENSILRITSSASKNASRPYMNEVRFYDLRTSSPTLIYSVDAGNLRNCYLALGYDDSLHLSYFLIAGQFYTGSWDAVNSSYKGILGGSSTSGRQTMYELISGSQTPTYTWQSVPSISGKNGILSLAQIKDEYINEGESVSGASADHFTNLSTENRVDVLIDAALPDPETGGTTVTVKYTIPTLSTGSYEYCKLVAKKNSMAEGPEDGDKIIDIDPSLTSIVVRGLDQNSHYYFMIFIEDELGNTASSEPMDCVTGEIARLVIKEETVNSFGGNNAWYSAHLELPNRYAYQSNDYDWHTQTISVDKDVSYFGLCANNAYAEYKDIKCTYTDIESGTTITNEDIKDLINNNVYNNVIHCDGSTIGDGDAWIAFFCDAYPNMMLQFEQVVYDRNHIIHLGRPYYSVMGLSYDSTTNTFTVTNLDGLHADNYAVPLKKKIHLTSFTFSVRQTYHYSITAWAGSNIAFLNFG